MNIIGIERVTYGVDRMEDCIRFHEDWGLQRIAHDGPGAEFKLLDGTSLAIRPHDDPSLPSAELNWVEFGPRATLREAIWAVDTAETLQAVAAELSRDRDVTEDANGILHTVDEYGYHIGFAVTQRKDLTVPPPPMNGVGVDNRTDVPSDGARKRAIQPMRFSHIVYWAPGDVEAAMAFYTDRLGFRVTDYMGERGGFMQAGGSTEHHNLYLQKGGDFKGFQHLTYEVISIDEVMMLGMHMESRGWTTNVGPLRHNISGSFSWYMWCPAGGLVEVLADFDRPGPDWQVRRVDTKSPDFYGHSWVARPEHIGLPPGTWKEGRGAPPDFPG